MRISIISTRFTTFGKLQTFCQPIEADFTHARNTVIWHKFCVMRLGQKDPVSVCQSFMSSWIDFTLAMTYQKLKAKEQYVPAVLVFSNVHLHNKCKSGPDYCQSSTEILVTAEDLKKYRYLWNSGWITLYLLSGPFCLATEPVCFVSITTTTSFVQNCSCMSAFYICLSSVMNLGEITRG